MNRRKVTDRAVWPLAWNKGHVPSSSNEQKESNRSCCLTPGMKLGARTQQQQWTEGKNRSCCLTPGMKQGARSQQQQWTEGKNRSCCLTPGMKQGARTQQQQQWTEGKNRSCCLTPGMKQGARTQRHQGHRQLPRARPTRPRLAAQEYKVRIHSLFFLLSISFKSVHS